MLWHMHTIFLNHDDDDDDDDAHTLSPPPFTATAPAPAGVPGAILGHQISKEGERPVFPLATPAAYKDLAERCWSPGVAERCGAESGAVCAACQAHEPHIPSHAHAHARTHTHTHVPAPRTHARTHNSLLNTHAASLRSLGLGLRFGVCGIGWGLGF